MASQIPCVSITARIMKIFFLFILFFVSLVSSSTQKSQKDESQALLLKCMKLDPFSYLTDPAELPEKEKELLTEHERLSQSINSLLDLKDTDFSFYSNPKLRALEKYLNALLDSERARVEDVEIILGGNAPEKVKERVKFRAKIALVAKKYKELMGIIKSKSSDAEIQRMQRISPEILIDTTLYLLQKVPVLEAYRKISATPELNQPFAYENERSNINVDLLEIEMGLFLPEKEITGLSPTEQKLEILLKEIDVTDLEEQKRSQMLTKCIRLSQEMFSNSWSDASLADLRERFEMLCKQHYTVSKSLHRILDLDGVDLSQYSVESLNCFEDYLKKNLDKDSFNLDCVGVILQGELVDKVKEFLQKPAETSSTLLTSITMQLTLLIFALLMLLGVSLFIFQRICKKTDGETDGEEAVNENKLV